MMFSESNKTKNIFPNLIGKWRSTIKVNPQELWKQFCNAKCKSVKRNGCRWLLIEGKSGVPCLNYYVMNTKPYKRHQTKITMRGFAADETLKMTEQTKNDISSFLFAIMVLQMKKEDDICKQLKQPSLSSGTKI